MQQVRVRWLSQANVLRVKVAGKRASERATYTCGDISSGARCELRLLLHALRLPTTCSWRCSGDGSGDVRSGWLDGFRGGSWASLRVVKVSQS